jgi:hypothetical protein
MTTTGKCKTKYLAKSALLYTAVAAGLILSAKIIFAQEQPQQRSIIISPPSVERTEDPGTTGEGILKITNNSATQLTFKAFVRDFVVDNPDGIPHVLIGNTLSTKYSASAWIGVSPNSFTLAPGKTQELSYYLQIPKDARPGGHYAAVMYEPQEALGAQGTGAGVETHIGSLFYIHVKGNIVENASVKSFSANNFQEYGPVTIKTQIANSSDTDIKPQGTITVKNILGQVAYSQPLEEHNIYPEAVRNFQNTLGHKFMFGPYTAELKATYGEAYNHTLFASLTFFILPWKIVALVLLAIIVIVLLFIWLRRKKKKTPPPPPVTQAPPVATDTQVPQQPAQ